MASPHYFFVAASEQGEIFAGTTGDLNRTMLQLSEKPRRTASGSFLFDRLIHFDQVRCTRFAKHLLLSFKNKSPRERLQFLYEVNPDWQDLSSFWFPVAAATAKPFPSIFDLFGDSSGGVNALLIPRVPPRTSSEQVDPFSRMSFEDLLECGAYKVLSVGSR